MRIQAWPQIQAGSDAIVLIEARGLYSGFVVCSKLCYWLDAAYSSLSSIVLQLLLLECMLSSLTLIV